MFIYLFNNCVVINDSGLGSVRTYIYYRLLNSLLSGWLNVRLMAQCNKYIV